MARIIKDYFPLVEMYDIGLSNEAISSLLGIETSTAERYRNMYNTAKGGTYVTSPTNVAFCGALNEHFKLTPPEEPETAATAVPTNDNTALYLTKTLEALHDIDEHLLQLMDADLREAASMIIQCVTAEVSAIQNTQNEMLGVIKSMQGEIQTLHKVISLIDNSDMVNICCSDILRFITKNSGSQTEGALVNYITNQKGYAREVHEKAIFKLMDSKKLKAVTIGSGASKMVKYTLG